MDFCPVCSLDLSLVKNKDFHVNSCFENNNKAEEIIEKITPQKPKAVPQKPVVQPIAQPLPKGEEVRVVPRKVSKPNNVPNSRKNGERKEIYVVCPYINCDFSSLTELFPSHVLTDHIEEPKQNYACPICSNQGLKYNPGPGSNLLIHISEAHTDFLDIYSDVNNKADEKYKKRRMSRSISTESWETETGSGSENGLIRFFNSSDDEEGFIAKRDYYPKFVPNKPIHVRNNKNLENDLDQAIDMSFLSEPKKEVVDDEIIEYWNDSQAEESTEDRKEQYSEKKIVLIEKIEKKETKTEPKKLIKAEVKKPIQIEEKKPIKQEEKKPIKIEEKKPIKIEEKKQIKIEEKKPIKIEDKKPIKREEKKPTTVSPPKRPMFINLEGHPKEYLAAAVNIEIIPDQECPICYDSFVMHQITSRLECFCLYHKDCIELWWTKKEQRTCPFHVFEKYEETKKKT